MDILINKYAQQMTSEKTNYILSECHDHFWAGVTTTTDALLALMFQLSLPKNIHRQQRLREELSNLEPKVEVTEVKFLDYVIKESLRLHPPVIGSLDRITTEAITVDGIHIPSGMEIGAQPYSLHWNADVFPSPDQWQPERWEVDSGSEEYRSMNRHLFAFGNGPRMCIGMNMAYGMMRHAIASVYSTFQTTLSEDLVAGPVDSARSQEDKMKKWIRAKRCPVQFDVLCEGKVSTHSV
jgi:cytochrome P450